MLQCGQCSKEIHAADRLPPWCPHCGVDMKVARGEAPPAATAVAAPQTAAPAGPVAATSSLATWPTPAVEAREETLRDAIQRLVESQHDGKTAHRGRTLGLYVFLVGLLILGSLWIVRVLQ